MLSAAEICEKVTDFRLCIYVSPVSGTVRKSFINAEKVSDCSDRKVWWFTIRDMGGKPILQIKAHDK